MHRIEIIKKKKTWRCCVLLVIRERLLRRRQLLLRRRLGVFETGLLRGRLRHPLLHRRDLHLQILLEHLIPCTQSIAPSGPRLPFGRAEGSNNYFFNSLELCPYRVSQVVAYTFHRYCPS